jgi:hypothetical protein
VDRFPVAGELMLAAIDERTGEPLLHRAALGLGLAGGLIAEQVLAGRVGLTNGTLFTRPADPPTDAIGEAIMRELSRQPSASVERDVRLWLSKLAAVAVDEVGRRLVGARMVRATERKRLLRHPETLFVPVDPAKASVAGYRAMYSLARMQPMDTADRTVVGLIRITNLIDYVDWLETTPRRLRELTVTAEQALPADLQALLSHVESAIGAAILSGRR